MRIDVRRWFVLLFMLLISVGSSAAAEKKTSTPPQIIKQGEFAAMLISAFGWQQGLPEKPSEDGYLGILGGRRTFRFEAEDCYEKKTDNVYVKEYERFGTFSGKGWVSGVAVPTTVHFNLFIPLEGDYTLKVSSKGIGQIWSVEGKTFKVDGGDKLREESAGVVHLKPGRVKISAEIPAEGGIDYLVLEAPKLAAIEPLNGWRFKEPLTSADVAQIASALLGWERAMPDDNEWKPLKIAVAEAAFLPPNVKKTTIPYLGAFSAKQWVRADRDVAVLKVPLIIRTAGAYDMKINYMGEILVAELDGRKIERAGKPYLDWVDLGLNRMKTGAHTLILRIAAGGGADVIIIGKRKSTPADYLKLAGIGGDPSDQVTREQADKYITSFLERFKERP